jgi:hypothetical protein
MMRGRSLIGRACLPRRSSPAAVRALYVAVLVWWATVVLAGAGWRRTAVDDRDRAQPARGSARQLPRLSRHHQPRSCRVLGLRARPCRLRPRRDDHAPIGSRRGTGATGENHGQGGRHCGNRVQCNRSILVNDVIHCRDASGDIAGCVDRLSTSSKLAVSLLK